MTRWWKTAAATAAVLTTAMLTAPTAGAAGPYCGITWGSLEKSATSAGTGTEQFLTDIRAGRHACFDRLVLDFGGDGVARVRYVGTVHAEGTGDPIPLRGAADLEIVTGPMYDPWTGEPTYNPVDRDELVDTRGYSTLKQVASGGSFEGQSTLGAGVRARLPFRVFALGGPGQQSRIVIDVAHRW